jgi:hypothetical protein
MSITRELIENRRQFLRGITDPDNWVDALCDAALLSLSEREPIVAFDTCGLCGCLIAGKNAAPQALAYTTPNKETGVVSRSAPAVAAVSPDKKWKVRVTFAKNNMFDLYVGETYCGTFDQPLVTPLANALTEALREVPSARGDVETAVALLRKWDAWWCDPNLTADDAPISETTDYFHSYVKDKA